MSQPCWPFPPPPLPPRLTSSPRSCPPLSGSPAPSHPSGRGRGPPPPPLQHAHAGAGPAREGDPSHPSARARGAAHLQGEVHPPRAQHVGLLCGQSKTCWPLTALCCALCCALCMAWSGQSSCLTHLDLPTSPPQPFLPPSDSGALYDSDESGASDNDDDDDAFLSDTQMTEHSDPTSYRFGYHSTSYWILHALYHMVHTES